MQAALLKPPRVRPGETVAIVAPSLGAVGRWPHRATRGVRYLQELGLEVRMMPNATRDDGWTSAPPEARAADLHQAFLDDDVSVVLAAIGGHHSNQLLPFLDFDLIRSHPKVFQGYSDVTVLHWALAKFANLGTFYGPALVPELGEFPHVLDYTDRFLRRAWCEPAPIEFSAAESWTDEHLDWTTRDDETRARELRPSQGWLPLRGGTARGQLFGGCLETICWHLKGSTEWVDLEGVLLLLETSADQPSPAAADAALTDLRRLGVFDAIAGLLVGRPYGFTAAEAECFWQVVTRHTQASGIPVLGNVDAGHTDPMATIPFAVKAELDVERRTFWTLEAATV